MMSFLIAAAAVAGTSDISTVADPADDGGTEAIVVEGRRSQRDWALPKLEYDQPENCPALVESEIPGFGVLRLRKGCATDRTEEWRLFQY